MSPAFIHGMLKITFDTATDAVTIVLEGKLSRDWIPQVLESWISLASQGRAVILDLSSVLSVDAAGRRLLAEMYARGVRLTGSGIMIRGLIEELMTE